MKIKFSQLGGQNIFHLWDDHFFVDLRDSMIYGEMKTTEGIFCFASESSIKRDEWHFLTLTYDLQEMLIAVNGQVVGREKVGGICQTGTLLIFVNAVRNSFDDYLRALSISNAP